MFLKWKKEQLNNATAASHKIKKLCYKQGCQQKLEINGFLLAVCQFSVVYFEEFEESLWRPHCTACNIVKHLDGNPIDNPVQVCCVILNNFWTFPNYISPFREQNNMRAVNRTCERFCACDLHTCLSQ